MRQKPRCWQVVLKPMLHAVPSKTQRQRTRASAHFFSLFSQCTQASNIMLVAGPLLWGRARVPRCTRDGLLITHTGSLSISRGHSCNWLSRRLQATSAAADPAEAPQAGTSTIREQTADQVLQLLDGKLGNSERSLEAELGNAVHVLPVRVVPPRAWQSLERAMSSGTAFSSALAPRWHDIPAFHTTADCKCCIASSSRGRRFKAKELNIFSALLFECLPAAVQVAGLPQVQLNRYDLHHGHIFLSHRERRLGVLFHAKEYPAAHPEEFPVHLGNCQRGSSLEWRAREMDYRNILWYGGSLCALDLGEVSPLHDRLLIDGLQPVRTVLEADFGWPLADLYYFHELQNRKARHRLFVCVPGT